MEEEKRRGSQKLLGSLTEVDAPWDGYGEWIDVVELRADLLVVFAKLWRIDVSEWRLKLPGAYLFS